MRVETNITEQEIKEVVLQVMERSYRATFSAERNHADRIVTECVREIIYADKDRIIDKVIERATKEIVRKGLPKLLDKVMKGGAE